MDSSNNEHIERKVCNYHRISFLLWVSTTDGCNPTKCFRTKTHSNAMTFAASISFVHFDTWYRYKHAYNSWIVSDHLSKVRKRGVKLCEFLALAQNFIWLFFCCCFVGCCGFLFRFSSVISPISTGTAWFFHTHKLTHKPTNRAKPRIFFPRGKNIKI